MSGIKREKADGAKFYIKRTTGEVVIFPVKDFSLDKLNKLRDQIKEYAADNNLTMRYDFNEMPRLRLRKRHWAA